MIIIFEILHIVAAILGMILFLCWLLYSWEYKTTYKYSCSDKLLHEQTQQFCKGQFYIEYLDIGLLAKYVLVLRYLYQCFMYILIKNFKNTRTNKKTVCVTFNYDVQDQTWLDRRSSDILSNIRRCSHKI